MSKYLFLFLISMSSQLLAQTFYLNIWSKGNVTSIPISSIQKITFTDVIDTFGNQSEISVIQIFKLGQNYPNPFNPHTTFAYQIPAAGEVKIKIYNLKGELVTTVTQFHSNAGDYRWTWDGTDERGQAVPSGLYLYQVTYANSIQNRKMILVK